MFRVSPRIRLSRFILAAAFGVAALATNVGAASASDCASIYFLDLCDVRVYDPYWEEDCPQCGQVFLPREDDWRVLFERPSLELEQQFQFFR